MRARCGSSKGSPKVCAGALVVVLILAVAPLRAAAEEAAADKLGASYFRQVGRDFVAVCVSPKDWRGGDILKFLAVAGLGAVVVTQEEDIRDWVLKTGQKPADLPLSSGPRERRGSGGLDLGLYAVGEVTDEPGSETSLLGLKVLDDVSLRPSSRPSSAARGRGGGTHGLSSLLLHEQPDVVPSGDSSAAWSVATVMPTRRTTRLWMSLLWPGDPCRRLACPRRQTLDVRPFLGSAIGYFTAKKITGSTVRTDRPWPLAWPDLTAGLSFLCHSPSDIAALPRPCPAPLCIIAASKR
jgi:hypothetical protein